MESRKRPSKLIFVVLNFMTATSPGAWHCCTSDDVIDTCAHDLARHLTVAEKDIAAAAQAALGPPESRCWPPKGRPSAAAGRRGLAAPAKALKSIFSSRMVNWTTLGVV